jgi:hypothetical protein
MRMISTSTRQWRIAIGVSRRQLVFAILAGTLAGEPVLAAPTVTSLTLSPSTIAGGTGSTSTATVTLSEAAPAGGTVVTIGTSNPGLAASVQSVVVPAGAKTTSFAVATNAKYRRYSGLAFTVAISASAGGTTGSATLNVTAQPMPADIDGDSTQRFGTVCGGNFPAGRGDHGILFDCQVGPDFGTVGKCSFRQECALGCTTKASNNFQFFDVCATSGPYPIQVSPVWIEGGNAATATLLFASAAPSGTNAFGFAASSVATAFPQGYQPVPAGATSVTRTVATSILPSVQFVELDANFEIPTPQSGGSTLMADRPGLAWLAVAPPPRNAPPAPEPVLGFFEISPRAVTGGNNSSATIWLSSVSSAGGPTVSLTSSDDAVASVAPSVTIAPGSNVAVETVTTRPVAASTSVAITATEASRSLRDTLIVTPASCVPTTCSAQGKNCGSIPDGCGGTLVCGTCDNPMTCGGGGVPNVCAVPPADSSFSSPAANGADAGGDGNGFESNATSAHSFDGVTAVDSNSGTGTGTSCTSTGKDRHQFYNYGFAVPGGSTVTGLEVRLDARGDSTSGSPKMCVQLSWDGGTNWTAAKATGTLGTTQATFTLGSTTDTWGRTWSAADLADAAFRVRVIDVSSSTSRDFFLDWVAVRPTFTSGGPTAVNAISLSPATVVGGNPSTGTVTLTGGAPSGGAAVTLSSSSNVATVPAGVTVAGGASAATFPVRTIAVTANQTPTISASFGGVTKSATLNVTASGVSLASVTVNPSSVKGGDDSQGTVTLTAAPSSDTAVSLSAGSTSVATLPVRVIVKAGSKSATFTVATNRVSTSTNVTISATLGGVTKTATLTVTSER